MDSSHCTEYTEKGKNTHMFLGARGYVASATLVPKNRPKHAGLRPRRSNRFRGTCEPFTLYSVQCNF